MLCMICMMGQMQPGQRVLDASYTAPAQQHELARTKSGIHLPWEYVDREGCMDGLPKVWTEWYVLLGSYVRFVV